MKKFFIFLILLLTHALAYWAGGYTIYWGRNVHEDGTVSKYYTPNFVNTKEWATKENCLVNNLLFMMEDIHDADTALYDSIVVKDVLFKDTQNLMDDIDLTFNYEEN